MISFTAQFKAMCTNDKRHKKIHYMNTIRELIKHFYNYTKVGNILISPAMWLYHIYRYHILSEKEYIKQTFKNILSYELNLDNPKTLNEKIHWLQKNDRTPLYTLCSDKYAVRKYVKEKIGEQYLIPLVLQTTNPKEIIPDNLPDYPFIIKTNHGCGGHVRVKDKSKIDWNRIQKHLKKSLKSNFYYQFREWQYKNIKPCIIVEKLLLDKNSNIPYDYKFHCFNGKVEIISADMHRYIDLKRNVYDKDWNFIDCRMRLENGGKVKKPYMLNKMKSLAEALAQDFKYVRVDLYNIDSKIYFGELTFSPAAGFQQFIPAKWDRILGNKLVLH